MTKTELIVNNYIREARRLKKKLYDEPYPIFGIKDAQLYIEITQKYLFLVGVLADFGCSGWQKDDFVYRD